MSFYFCWRFVSLAALLMTPSGVSKYKSLKFLNFYVVWRLSPIFRFFMLFSCFFYEFYCFWSFTVMNLFQEWCFYLREIFLSQRIIPCTWGSILDSSNVVFEGSILDSQSEDPTCEGFVWMSHAKSVIKSGP